MKSILNELFHGKRLSYSEAYTILTNLAKNKFNTPQMVAFLTTFNMRSIDLRELEGFKDAMLDLCNQVNLNDYPIMDVCGTGGDGKNSFNISTISTFVSAGAGLYLAKHGNNGVSSFCGSSNLLEYLGVKFQTDSSILKKSLDRSRIAFLHAPLFHPAMKSVAEVRRDLGVKTFFNMLGPLVNPAKPKIQLVGVFNLELARNYSYIYQNSEVNYTIVHSLDGYDEISLTADVKIFNTRTERIISPPALGFNTLQHNDILGGNDLKEAAMIFHNVLSNKATPAQHKVVVANSAMAIQTAHPDRSWETCVHQAEESITSGNALKCFQEFLNINS